jgi:uncharacterized coiled-coil DUF342 family protein
MNETIQKQKQDNNEKLSNLQDCIGGLEDLLKPSEERERAAHKAQQLSDKIPIMQSMNKELKDAILSMQSELSQAQAQLGEYKRNYDRKTVQLISELGTRYMFASHRMSKESYVNCPSPGMVHIPCYLATILI